MSYNEYRVWAGYRKKYGPMSDVRRFDRPAALLATIFGNSHGGKFKMIDFMPWGQETKDPSLEDFISSLGKGVKIGR